MRSKKKHKQQNKSAVGAYLSRKKTQQKTTKAGYRIPTMNHELLSEKWIVK